MRDMTKVLAGKVIKLIIIIVKVRKSTREKIVTLKEIQRQRVG